MLDKSGQDFCLKIYAIIKSDLAFSVSIKNGVTEYGVFREGLCFGNDFYREIANIGFVLRKRKRNIGVNNRNFGVAALEGVFVALVFYVNEDEYYTKTSYKR